MDVYHGKSPLKPPFGRICLELFSKHLKQIQDFGRVPTHDFWGIKICVRWEWECTSFYAWNRKQPCIEIDGWRFQLEDEETNLTVPTR